MNNQNVKDQGAMTSLGNPFMLTTTPLINNPTMYYHHNSPSNMMSQSINNPNIYPKYNQQSFYNYSNTYSINTPTQGFPNFQNTPVQTPQISNTNQIYQIKNLNQYSNMNQTPCIGGQTSMYSPMQRNNTYRNESSFMNNKIPEANNRPNIAIDVQPTLQNIVSTANLGCPLELREIALQAKNAEYNPKRFAAVIMRIKKPKTTALIFSSGKMVCTGAKSEEESRQASRIYAKIIQKIGFQVKFHEFKIQNIVGSCDVKFPITLSKLNIELSKTPKEKNNSEKDKEKNLAAGAEEKKSSGKDEAKKRYICHYEPEVFPGLIYHMFKPEIVLLIFVSGKIVLTGAKEKSEIFEAFRNIYPVLLKHKLDNKEGKTSGDLHREEIERNKMLKKENNGEENNNNEDVGGGENNHNGTKGNKKTKGHQRKKSS